MSQPSAAPTPHYDPAAGAVDAPDHDAALRRLFHAQLEQLFLNVPEGIVLLDNHDRVVRANPEFSRMFGYAADELLGRPINTLIVPDHLLAEATALTRRVLQGERFEAETVRRRSDGSLIDVSVLGVPVTVDGEQVGVYGIYRDITEQKRIEAERDELLARERREHSSSPAAARRDEILRAVGDLLERDEAPEQRLRRLARLLVPELADSCIVYLRDEAGEVRRLEVAFADSAQEELLREQLRHYPPEPRRLIPPVARALDTGVPQLLPEVSIGALKAVPGDTEHVSVALLVGLSSLLVVPLLVEGRTVGAISLGTTDSGRRYHAADLMLAEEVARRAASVFGPRTR